MKVIQSGGHSSNRTPANYFSAYVYASHFISGVHVLRAIYFGRFGQIFWRIITPVLPLTEALLSSS